ncbi:hypothetical protein WJX81_003728 [Elliptochloris bilobata]|uniref:Uncharacterized protein n=1 Tax=Elliptochloris bilobata TaxID=381761 RepID=A0AAW1SL50_9CHLO
MALNGAVAWCLDLLLEDEGLEQQAVKTLLDRYCAGDVRALPKSSQCRVVLRLVHDGAAALAADLADHLSSLAAWSRDDPTGFPPGANLPQICPPPELVARVKASIVLAAAGENPQKGLEVLNQVYQGLVMDESGASQLELAQRNNLVEAIQSGNFGFELPPREALAGELLQFVAAARQALGPPFLKMVEHDVQQGLYQPSGLGEVGQKRARTGPEDDALQAAGVIADLQRTKGAAGAEPLNPALQGALQSILTMSNTPEMLAMLQAHVGAGGAARPMMWGTPGAEGGIPGMEMTPNGGMMMDPNAAGDANLAGTPKQRGTGGPRRRNGRWSEQETATLIDLVRRNGKGKWKKILEDGREIFLNRTQVDLKDKWRNLERQHQVGPADCGPQDPPSGSAPQPPQPLALVDPATAAAAEHLAATAVQMHGVGMGVPAMDGMPPGHPGMPGQMPDMSGMGGVPLGVPPPEQQPDGQMGGPQMGVPQMAAPQMAAPQMAAPPPGYEGMV